MTKSPFFVGVLGALAWAAGIFVVRPTWAAALLLLAPFVIVPMGLRLAATPNRDGRHPASYRAAVWLALPAAVSLMASFAMAPSRLAGVLAFPWLGVTLLAAIFGARRVAQRGVGPSEELCIDVALLFLAVGGAWGVLCRGFERPLGFDGLVATLTAVHFHYAGFTLCLFVGLAGRRMRNGAPLLVVVSVIGGICALAAGIGARVMMLEQLAGWSLALGGCLVAAVHLHLATSPGKPVFRLLIALSGLCLAGALVLGALFAARSVLVVPWVADLGHMAHFHGSANALGFAMLGAFAWSSAPARPRVADPGIPFSALAARTHVGANFFERTGAADPEARAPRGLVDSLEEHRRPALATDRVHAAVRAFYERTADHELVVTTRWRGAFRLAARIFLAFARVMGQLELPLGGERDPDRVSSRLVALDAAKDGRPGARGWVRTRARRSTSHAGERERAMYIAAYATHSYEGTAYMNIAFPLPFPFANLTSILRMDPLDVGDDVLGVELTTRAPPRTPSDAGIWLVVRLFGALRLPLHETIRVWPTSARFAPHSIETRELPGATAVARHELRIFGVRYLTLDYLIRPLPLEARMARASFDSAFDA